MNLPRIKIFDDFLGRYWECIFAFQWLYLSYLEDWEDSEVSAFRNFAFFSFFACGNDYGSWEDNTLIPPLGGKGNLPNSQYRCRVVDFYFPTFQIPTVIFFAHENF